MTTLVFPSCIQSSHRYAEEAKRRGERTIGASSLDADPYAASYDIWEKLPNIHEAPFADALKMLVDKHQVKALYTGHAPSYLYLSEHLQQIAPKVKLLGESPYKTEMDRITKRPEARRKWPAAHTGKSRIEMRY